MNPVSFVVEVSSNHHRDLARCIEFIDQAAKIGCDAVKFQLFKIQDLFAPNILDASPEHRRRKDWELPLWYLPELARVAREVGLEFGCTPFYLEAVEELEEYVDFYKIASYELLWDDLLIACGLTGKPVVLSTGMATLEETRHAVKVLQGVGCPAMTLLHCVSSYPVPLDDCNLAAIDTLQREFSCRSGWSDHSVSPAVIYRAVHKWRASMVEFHMDLDGQGEEYSMGHCWLPEEIQPVIEAVNQGFQADGQGIKAPAASELPERAWRTDPQDGLRPLKDIRTSWRP